MEINIAGAGAGKTTKIIVCQTTKKELVDF